MLAIAVYCAALLIAVGVLCDWLPFSFPLYFPVVLIIVVLQVAWVVARFIRAITLYARRTNPGRPAVPYTLPPRAVDLPRVITRPPEERQEMTISELIDSLGGERPPPAHFDSEGGFHLKDEG